MATAKKNTNKTQETKASVPGYIAAIQNADRRNDVQVLVELFARELKLEPKMWGPSIVGFGSYHYVYDSGREGDAPLAGLSSRADSISLYLSSSFDQREELLGKLGKHKSAKACVYVKSVKDIDLKVLAKMVKLSAAHIKKTHA
jgi:Domain of unknown function (DU1801)